MQLAKFLKLRTVRHLALCSCEEEIEKEACFILGLLAIKQEHQHAIADEGALAGLVRLLKRYLPATNLSQGPGASLVRRAADAVTNLAHENVIIKSRVRGEGGIPPLVALLVRASSPMGCVCLPAESQVTAGTEMICNFADADNSRAASIASIQAYV